LATLLLSLFLSASHCALFHCKFTLKLYATPRTAGFDHELKPYFHLIVVHMIIHDHALARLTADAPTLAYSYMTRLSIRRDASVDLGRRLRYVRLELRKDRDP
jgi:hypothetical protein